jgi:hypothetical protein
MAQHHFMRFSKWIDLLKLLNIDIIDLVHRYKKLFVVTWTASSSLKMELMKGTLSAKYVEVTAAV